MGNWSSKRSRRSKMRNRRMWGRIGAVCRVGPAKVDSM